MNVSSFLRHHGIASNPFAAEEARQDDVFARLEDQFRHPDFDKIAGDLYRPSSSVVFGERGTGKTAIRMQLERRLREHNDGDPRHRCLGVAYDDFNSVLGAFTRSQGPRAPEGIDLLRQIGLADHMDAILSLAVPPIVDRMLGDRTPEGAATHLWLDEEPAKLVRSMDRASRRDLLLLQACYDRPERAGDRTERLRRALRIGRRDAMPLLQWSAIVAAAAALVLLLWSIFSPPEGRVWAWNTAIVALAVAALGLAGRFGWLWWKRERLARRLARSLRMLDRPAPSFRRSLQRLGSSTDLDPALPSGDGDESRFAMFRRLLDGLRPLGYGSVLVIVDRVDEPTAIAGDAEKMQALVWPLFNSKFLQQDHIGIKLLLPIEIRHLVSRESGSFFREARLDKQNLIERLAWSGATLYDLCTARVNACRETGTEAISLMSLFTDEIRQQDVVDALDQLQQPRDAFKFLYQIIQEHCTSVPEESPQYEISRPLFDAVRRRQVERMQEMLKGVRPA